MVESICFSFSFSLEANIAQINFFSPSKWKNKKGQREPEWEKFSLECVKAIFVWMFTGQCAVTAPLALRSDRSCSLCFTVSAPKNNGSGCGYAWFSMTSICLIWILTQMPLFASHSVKAVWKGSPWRPVSALVAQLKQAAAQDCSWGGGEGWKDHQPYLCWRIVSVACTSDSDS